MDLEEHHIIKFLRSKGLKLGEITKELSRAYGPNTYTPPSIKYWLHEIMLGKTDLRTQHADMRAALDDIDTENLSFLRKHPLSSARTISRSLHIPD